MGDFWRYIAALLPSTGVGFLFYVVIKAMIEGDRRERRALAQWEAAHPELRTDIRERTDVVDRAQPAAQHDAPADTGLVNDDAHVADAPHAESAHESDDDVAADANHTVTRRTGVQE